jgi:serine/threonine-protein kinase
MSVESHGHEEVSKDSVKAEAVTVSCPACGLPLAPGTMICPNDGTAFEGGQLLSQKLTENYKFESVINSGGMGVIYRARHKILDKPVAIKMLRPGRFTENALIRFQREGKATSALSHKNIVSIYDFGITEFGQPYMVMEFVDGLSITDRLARDGHFSVEDTVTIATQVCDAIEHAHQNGILHRDIKSSNIMVNSDLSVVKVVDFGVAKSLDPESSIEQAQLTGTGDAVGSPIYMSPEQGLGQKIDGRADLYSLGCVIFECLAGAPPFVGKTSLETMMMRLNQDPPSLKEATLGGKFPAYIETVVAKLLQREPEKRYQSAAEVKLALLDQDSTAVDVPTSLRRSANSAGKAGATSKQQGVTFVPPAAVALLAVAMIATLAAGGFVLLRNQSKPKSVPLPANPAPAASADKVDDFMTFESDVSETRDAYVESHEKAREKIKNCKGDTLSLCRTDVADFDLRLLADKPKVKNLDLYEATIGDGGVNYLQNLKLERLNLSGTQITDQSLKTLSKIKTLQILYLNRCEGLTAAGIKYLGALKGLKELCLASPNVTEKDVQGLYRVLPNCAIYSNLSERLERSLDRLSNEPAERERQVRAVLSEMKKYLAPNHRAYFVAYFRLGGALLDQKKYAPAAEAFLAAYRNGVMRDSQWDKEGLYYQSASDQLRSAFHAAICYLNLKQLDTARHYAELAAKKEGYLHEKQSDLLDSQLLRAARDLADRGMTEESQLVESWYRGRHQLQPQQQQVN